MTLCIDALRAEAESGSVVAQAVLGIALLTGHDTKRDPVEAFRWLSSASARGVPRAMWNLGTMYEEGLVVSADPEKARVLYEGAAERGEFYARIFLARLLRSGKCGTVNEDAVFHWYRPAVEQAEHVQECAELEEARDYLRRHERAG